VTGAVIPSGVPAAVSAGLDERPARRPRWDTGVSWRTVLLHVLLAAIAGVAVAPLAWMVSASFMPAGSATTYPPPLLPHPATWANYRELFSHLDLSRELRNSAIVAGLITASSLLFNSMAGYAFAKFSFPARDRLFRLVLLGLFIPPQVAMLPLFILLRELHLVNSFAGVVLPSMATVFGMFLVRQYVLGIPDELLDAARVDGAGELRIYWSIVLPLCAPVLVTLAVFVFMSAWNDFMWPLVVLTDSAKYTLPVGLANLSREHVQDTELMMAASVVTLLPVLLLFISLQRYYIRGITMGGVKG
jgi:multiple sugar transport system permease protein